MKHCTKCFKILMIEKHLKNNETFLSIQFHSNGPFWCRQCLNDTESEVSKGNYVIYT